MMNAAISYQSRRLARGRGLTTSFGDWCPFRGMTDEYAIFRRRRLYGCALDVALPSEATPKEWKF
jgi:hypothetical protein